MSSGNFILAALICAICVALVAVYDSIYDPATLLVAFGVYVAYALMLIGMIAADQQHD